MSEEEYSKDFEVDGVPYTAYFVRRPFREGIEISVEVDGEVITLAEFGFGEKSALEALTEKIRESKRKKKGAG